MAGLEVMPDDIVWPLCPILPLARETSALEAKGGQGCVTGAAEALAVSKGSVKEAAQRIWCCLVLQAGGGKAGEEGGGGWMLQLLADPLPSKVQLSSGYLEKPGPSRSMPAFIPLPCSFLCLLVDGPESGFLCFFFFVFSKNKSFIC